MSTPPQQRPPPPAAPPAVTPAAPATATHTHTQPLPRAFLATSAPQRAPTAPPPLFTGRPLNPNPTHASPTHGILYPVATPSYPASAAAAAAVANHRRIPQLSVGYPRPHPVAVPIARSRHPQVPTQQRSYAAVPRAVVAGVTPRPEQPSRGVPIAPQPHPKVVTPSPRNPGPAVTPSPQEHSNAKERESTKEDASTVVINDRKVNVLDSDSGSLYALCRSWVRNGVPHEIQPSFVGNVAPLLPRPLPASVVDSRLSEKDKDVEDQDSEEEKNDTGEYTAADLLKQHVTRAKKIRAKLRKERQVRIERYKQRLALLLPPPPPPPSE
ncbi:hypothetical protein ACQ4PT_030812 [Festuca glaucescens]